MLKRVVSLAVAVALTGSPFLLASGGNSGGGGGGGGGSNKTFTVKYTGIITNMVETEDGVLVTLGTSYYNNATVILVPYDCSVKINFQNASVDDLEVGDVATIVTAYPAMVATKVECTSSS